jgi:hypothetical protein
MIYCNNLDCEYDYAPIEMLSDYRVIDGMVFCIGCVEHFEYIEEMNAKNMPDSGYQEYEPEIGIR